MNPLIASFGYAFAGIGHMFRTQRNARIHFLIGLCACALGSFLPLARWEWAILVVMCTLVIAAEGLNTAIEATVDLVATDYHPLARVAKDVAAGMVLLCACAAVIIGCIIFLPHLWPRFYAIVGIPW